MSANMARVTTTDVRGAFIADPHSVTRNQGRQIDWANVPESYREGAAAVVNSGTASIGATSLTVGALTVALPQGTVLDFGGGKFARLTAAAAVGATTLAVTALPTALANNDTAYYSTPGRMRRLKAGTIVGELLGSGKVSPRVVTTNPATGILETDALENDKNAALTGYGVIVGGVVFGNLLVGGAPTTTVKNELIAAGTGFAFLTYGDDRS